MPSAIDTSQISGDTTINTHSRRASLKILNRNIKQVVLGDLIFDTWYYSPYPDSIILDSTGEHFAKNSNYGNNDTKLINGIGNHQFISRGDPACSKLYVCPYCFRYSPSENNYISHLYHHDYLKQEDHEAKPVPDSAFKVYAWEGYTVWEVDGESEKLYCQNLSLFGKLFLEQKSVFFDTAGFKYYVLTYDNAQNQPSSKGNRTRKRGVSSLSSVNSSQQRYNHEPINFTTQVLGFFSKETLSWDSNNLACILIFPPFQRRQLGQLLMAVSYKLSGWEWEGGVIGGPEKPLSTMGRKSYLRFWSERIVRFMMGQSADADGGRVFDKQIRKRRKRKPKIKGNNASLPTQAKLLKEEMTIKEIGNRTGMLSEDVIAALTDMGVCDIQTRRRRKKKKQDAVDQQHQSRNGTSSSTVNAAGMTNQSSTNNQEPEQPLATMTILRSKVLAWADANHVDIIGPVKEEGFLGEWALSDADMNGKEHDDQRGDEQSENSDIDSEG